MSADPARLWQSSRVSSSYPSVASRPRARTRPGPDGLGAPGGRALEAVEKVVTAPGGARLSWPEDRRRSGQKGQTPGCVQPIRFRRIDEPCEFLVCVWAYVYLLVFDF